MKRKRCCLRALSLSLLTIFNFTIVPLAPLAACAQPGHMRLARPGQSMQAPASENTVLSANSVPRLSGGVKEQHRLNLTIAIVKTWPGGVAPTPPPEAKPVLQQDQGVPESAPNPAPNPVPLQSMQGETDNSVSREKNLGNIAEAFPDQTPSYMPGNSYEVPGTTRTTSTTTTSSTTSTTSSTDWGNSNSSNSQSSNSKWKASQKSKGGSHMAGLGFGGFFRGFGGFGAGFSGLGLGLGGLGYGFALPHLRMPSFNLGAYGGLAMGGGIGLYGLWNGYKHSKKSRGASSTSSIANNSGSWGKTTTNNVCNNSSKTTTTTDTTPGYTVEQTGSGICPVPAETRPVSAQAAPTQAEVDSTNAEVATQTQSPPAVSHLAAAVAPSQSKIVPVVVADRLVVVPWDDWYRCFAGEVYQRWSANEPYAGDALAAITVTDKNEISVALLPNEQNTSQVSAEERDNFNRLVVGCLARFNHDKAIAMPKESRRKSVTFVLGFSAEEDGPSGCQAISMTDSEQYYEKAADKPKAVSMAMPR